MIQIAETGMILIAVPVGQCHHQPMTPMIG